MENSDNIIEILFSNINGTDGNTYAANSYDIDQNKLQEIATNYGGTLTEEADRYILSIENEEFCIAKNEKGYILNQREFDNSSSLQFISKVKTSFGDIFSLEDLNKVYSPFNKINNEPQFIIINKKFKNGGQPILLPLKTEDYFKLSKINSFLTNKFYIEEGFGINQLKYFKEECFGIYQSKYFNTNLKLTNLCNLIVKNLYELCPKCGSTIHQSLLEIIDNGNYNFICSNCFNETPLNLSQNYLRLKKNQKRCLTWR